MDELKLSLLGGVEIRQSGVAVTGFVSNKALALFCYLVVNGREQPRSVLQALLWGEASQNDAMNSLRNALSNLRRLFGDHLQISRQAVALHPDAPCWLDVRQFLLAAQGKKLQDGRLAPDDLQALETAASLYRGEFMAGFSVADAPDFEEWLLTQREQLRLLYLQTLHLLVLHYTAVGKLEDAIAINSRLLAAEPWHEESYQQQMTLLARAGRWSEALAQYRRCRDVLAQELGVTPMPETTALYERIKAAREMPRHNLPAPSTPLLGRDVELAELADMLRRPDCRLVTLTGPGGVGKTKLARALVRQLANAFLHGARFLPLATVPAPAFLDTAIASTLGIPLKPQPAPRQQILDYLRQLEQLLVLDNFDHLLDGVGLVADILDHAPDVRLLVTSRERLNLQAEWLYPLAGLPVSSETPETDSPAVNLFVSVARRVQRDFDPAEQATPVVEICRLLDGLPLGIKLAAAQTALLSPATIADSLRQGLNQLAVTWRDLPERHRSLRAVFEQSWRTLTPAEQAVFSRLALFPGGFTLQSGQAVAGLTPAILQNLIAKSLLWAADDKRYHTHETLRQFALEILTADPKVHQQAVQAYTAYFAQLLAAQENRFTTSLPEVMATLRPEADNLRQAWQIAVATADWENLGQMMGSLHRFYEAQTWYQEVKELFQIAMTTLAAQAKDHPLVWGKLLTHMAGMQFRLGQIDEGLQLAQEGVRLLASGEDENSLALAWNTLGILQIHSGKFEDATQTLRTAIDLYHRLGNRAEMVRPLANLGSAYTRLGRYAEGLAAMEEGLAVCGEIGDRRGEALFLNNIAANHLMQGRGDAARPYLEASLPICDEIGFDQVKQVALYNLGEIHLEQQQIEQAINVCQEAATIARRLDDRMSLARTYKLIGVAQTRRGDYSAARTAFKEGLQIARATKGVPAILDVLDGIATYFLVQNRRKEASELFCLLVHHPATESQYRERAQRKLAKLGEPTTGSRSLDEVVSWLLEEDKMKW